MGNDEGQQLIDGSEIPRPTTWDLQKSWYSSQDKLPNSTGAGVLPLTAIKTFVGHFTVGSESL